MSLPIDFSPLSPPILIPVLTLQDRREELLMQTLELIENVASFKSFSPDLGKTIEQLNDEIDNFDFSDRINTNGDIVRAFIPLHNYSVTEYEIRCAIVDCVEQMVIEVFENLEDFDDPEIPLPKHMFVFLCASMRVELTLATQFTCS